MDKWLVLGIMLLASVVISLMGAVIAGVLHLVAQPSGLPIDMRVILAAAYGGGVFIKIMTLCVIIGGVIAAVAALSA